MDYKSECEQLASLLKEREEELDKARKLIQELQRLVIDMDNESE